MKNRLTNYLLTVIAICLVLITLKMYNASFIPTAHGSGADKYQKVIIGSYDYLTHNFKSCYVDAQGALHVKEQKRRTIDFIE